MRLGIPIFITSIFLFFSNFGFCQAPGLPQRSGIVMATQALHFGDITIKTGSSGGTVTVDHNGSRSSTGDVILLSMGNMARQAIFEFKLCPGRIVTINYAPTVMLTGSKGGNITLHVGPTNYGPNGSNFISNKGCDDIHLIHVGGTIDVGSTSANPGGLYTGTFNITFIQE